VWRVAPAADLTLYVQITQDSNTYHITLLREEYIRLVCDGHSWKYLVGFFNRVLEIGLWPHPLDEQCERVAELRKRKDDSK
jgi:hypothetical protein